VRRGQKLWERPRKLPVEDIAIGWLNVRFWHKADIGQCTAHVRFRGDEADKAEHILDRAQLAIFRYKARQNGGQF
jgi:hypothetical protein